MNVIHLSKEEFYRTPYGAIPCGTPMRIRAIYDVNPEFPRLHVRYEAILEYSEFYIEPSSIKPHDNGYVVEFQIAGSFFQRSGLYFYDFAAGNDILGNFHQITVYEGNLTVPEWFLNTVIYQIFPDRFCKADDPNAIQKENSFLYGSWEDLPMYIKNEDDTIERWEFYGGNLRGISSKLAYIKNLGADTVYLNPVFEARSNHRYDTANYMKIDGLLGGNDAFDDLIDTGKSLQIRFILDGVFNHTGRSSIYFDAACSGQNPEYKDWYTFQPDGKYDCWWGVADLPAVNKKNKQFIDFITKSVVSYWSRKGISGWRLDVADELPDSWIASIRKAAEAETSEPVIIGEVWEDASNKISYGERKMYFTRPELHSHTNYPFRENLISFLDGTQSAGALVSAFETVRENYPKHNFYAQVNMTGSHDVERLMSVMLRITKQDIRLAKDLVKCYSLIQFTVPGVPLIYYGDETGLEGGMDPDNRRTYPWNHPDTDMITWFSSLCTLRSNNEILVHGDISYYALEDENLFGFIRQGAGQEGSCYITVCDRFGRGRAVLCDAIRKIMKSIENLSEKSYIITKEAGGYALLAEFLL